MMKSALIETKEEEEGWKKRRLSKSEEGRAFTIMEGIQVGGKENAER